MASPTKDDTCVLYILLCDDGTYYTGTTRNLADRLQRHRTRRGAVHTARRSAIRLVYTEKHPSRKAAMARERQIKRWSHAKKKALMKGDVDRLRQLSRRKVGPSEIPEVTR